MAVGESARMQIGELFILGFFGKTIPAWLGEFADRYGLGGVILFDYSCQTQKYDNNIDSPEQVQRLCEEISGLPSHPMVFIDQEGGLVRRLKEGRGFAPLPSAREFNQLGAQEKRDILTASFNIFIEGRQAAQAGATADLHLSGGVRGRVG